MKVQDRSFVYLIAEHIYIINHCHQERGKKPNVPCLGAKRLDAEVNPLSNRGKGSESFPSRTVSVQVQAGRGLSTASSLLDHVHVYIPYSC